MIHLMPWRDRLKASRLGRVLRSPVFLLLFCLSGIAIILSLNFALPYIYDRFHPIHLPPVACSEVREGELFCIESYLDDGRIRYSVSQSDRPNCCIFERYNFDEARVSYRVLACSAAASVVIDCSKMEESLDYGRSFRVDGTILTTAPH